MSKKGKGESSYYDEDPRYVSVYKEDYIKSLNDKDRLVKHGETLKTQLDRYQYSHDPTLVEMVTDKTKMKDEPYIQKKLYIIL